MTAKLFTLPRAVPVTNSNALMPGAKLYFYETLTSTPQDSYTTTALTVAHTNPVIADSNGEFAEIFLDDTLTYKMVLTDSSDVEKYSVDPYNSSFALTQQQVGVLLYPQTTAELSVAVTPTDYSYPELHVLRYGADPTGVADSASEIRNAIAVANAAKQTGNSGVYGSFAQQTGTNPEVDFGRGVFKIGSSLTTASSAGTDYVKYVGEGAQLVDTSRTVTCFAGIAWDVHWEGIKFRGFDTQVAIATNNVNRAMFTFKHVEFIDPATSAVLTDTNSNSTELIFDHITAHSDEAAVIMFDLLVDYCTFKNYWVQTSSDVTFKNSNFLLLESGVMIPSAPTSTQRWVDNFGQRFIVKHVRVSGESGGKRLLDHRIAIDSSAPINAIQVIIEDCEYYAVDEWIRLYEFPNLLQVHFSDDLDTGATTGIWADAVTDAQLKTWARYGTVDIDPRWGRTRVTNNAEVGTMMEIKNLKSHPVNSATARIPIANVVGRGDAATGWAESGTTTNSAGTNVYAAVTREYLATADDQAFGRTDSNCFVRGEMTRKPYTFCQEITWNPASGIGQAELFARMGYEQYIQRLLPGTHMYCFPFQYLNGGGAGDDTDLDEVRFESGARLANGDEMVFGAFAILDGVHFTNDINLVMVTATSPGTLSGTVGPNLYWLIGDLAYDTVPASGSVGFANDTATAAGNWVSV